MTQIWQFSRKKIVYISTRDIKREKKPRRLNLPPQTRLTHFRENQKRLNKHTYLLHLLHTSHTSHLDEECKRNFHSNGSVIMTEPFSLCFIC